jgi:hypothetical protein
MDIFWIMFWKSVVLALWACGEGYFESRRARSDWDKLLARFKHEWDRRCAEKPLLLPDLRSRLD